METNPSRCPSTVDRIVLPLRPEPAMKRTFMGDVIGIL
jgi:hypothetical protein